MPQQYSAGDLSAAQAAARSFRGGEKAFVMQPFGWKFSVFGSGDASHYDALPWIRYCDEMISTSVLAMVLSLDGGVSWRAFGSCGAEGGATGATESGYEITVPEPGNPNRQIAAVLAVTGAITLGITATVFP